MFNAERAFTLQFTPAKGGYVYYPSRHSGGKFVTEEEYERLLANWRRVAGIRGGWKTGGIAFLALLVWALVRQRLGMPNWTDWLVISVGVAAFSGWVLWASFAPRRLAMGRPDFAPPRPISEARRASRAALSWPFVIFALLLSGAAFFGALSSPNRAIA